MHKIPHQMYKCDETDKKTDANRVVQGKTDPERAVAAVDQSRYNTVRQIFSELGFEDDDLDMRTLLFVSGQKPE